MKEIKIRKCRRKTHADIIDEEMKGISSEDDRLEYVIAGEEVELIL